MDRNKVNEMLGLPPVESEGQSKNLLSLNEKASLLTPKPEWYSRTSVHIAAAGGGGVIFLIICLMFFGTAQQPQQQLTASAATDNEKMMANQLKQSEDEKERLRQEAFNASQPSETKIRVIDNNKPAFRPAPKPPKPQHISYAPRPVLQQPRIIPNRPAPSVAQSVERPVSLPVPPLRTASIPSSPALPPEDPNAAVERLNKLGVVVDGSGGQGSTSISSSGVDNSLQNASYETDSTIPQIGQSDYPPGTVAQSGNAIPQQNTSLPAQIATNSTGAFRVARKEAAKAKMLEPIRWSQDMPLEGQTFEAKLSEEFGSIPKGSIVTLQPDTQSSSASGLLKLVAVSIRVGETDYPVPQGIKVVATDGGLLEAKSVRPGSGFGLSNILQIGSGIVSSGLSQATSDTDSFLTRAGVQVGSQLLGTATSGFANNQGVRQSYFKFDKSIRLIATQDIVF